RAQQIAALVVVDAGGVVDGDPRLARERRVGLLPDRAMPAVEGAAGDPALEGAGAGHRLEPQPAPSVLLQAADDPPPAGPARASGAVHDDRPQVKPRVTRQPLAEGAVDGRQRTRREDDHPQPSAHARPATAGAAGPTISGSTRLASGDGRQTWTSSRK